jgi:hypothetical protein
MLLSACLAGLALAIAPQADARSDEQFFADLLRWRAQFETVLREPAKDVGGYIHVHSEMLGGAHGDASIR